MDQKQEIAALLAPANSRLPADFREREYSRYFGDMLGTALAALFGGVRALRDAPSPEGLIKQIEDGRDFWGRQITQRVIAMTYDWAQKGRSEPSLRYQVEPLLYSDPTHDAPVIAVTFSRDEERFEVTMPERAWNESAVHSEDFTKISGYDGWQEFERRFKAGILGGVLTDIHCHYTFPVLGAEYAQSNLRQVGYEEGFESSYIEIMAREMAKAR